MHETRYRNRLEGQNKRIIRLLEQAVDADVKDQCPLCGEWFSNLGAHERHCDA